MDDNENQAQRFPTSLNTGEVKGLPVAGYKPTQSGSAITMVNSFKELEERVLRRIEECERNCEPGVIDPRLMAIGRTQLQGAFMFIARSIFQPLRVPLPEDAAEYTHTELRGREYQKYDGHVELHSIAKDSEPTAAELGKALRAGGEASYEN